MIKMKLQVLLNACIINFIWIPIYSHNCMVDQNEAAKSKIYGKILRQEIAKEQLAFDEIKKELWSTQSKNTIKRRTFADKMSIFENIVARKRETDEYKNNIDHPFQEDRGKVEELFKRVHPNLTTLDLLEWDLVANISEAKLEKACRDVAIALNASHSQIIYVPPAADFLEDRVITYAPILFVAGNRTIKFTTLVNCTFTNIKFYLAKGNDDNHVFRLTKDSVDNIFYFQSGLHKIFY